MSPGVQRTDPPYLQIVGQIRQQILSGELSDGDMVPSARQIARDWNVALATATKVLNTLRADGLVEGMPGVGTVVNVRTTHPAPRDRIFSSQRTGKIYPRGHYARIQSADVVKASADIADALGVRHSSRVIRRERVTFNEKHQPIAVSVSWFPGSFIKKSPELLEAKRLPQGTVGYIEQTTGAAATTGRDQLVARGATTEDAESLGIDPGSPVLAGRNWVYDKDGNVIEYGEFTHPAGRWSSYDYQLV